LVDVILSIGEFSKMTYLSVKALRHYHDVGLLEPVDIDPATGYRRYAASQVATAQAIRRFRDLDMPIDDVRRVLTATTVDERNRVIVEHLGRMREELERTQASVDSLQSLLTEPPRPAAALDLRHLPPTIALVARAVVEFDAVGDWLEPALAGLHLQAVERGLGTVGADGALYPDELFETGTAEVTAFVPVDLRVAGTVELPATNVAVLVHVGSFTELDQAYGALGTAVAERGIGDVGAIREHYLDDTTTEVCWPVSIGTQSVR
jgi:DNA-binding transcriptional MerR regulator